MTRNHVGSARAGSNPAVHDFSILVNFNIQIIWIVCFALFFLYYYFYTHFTLRENNVWLM